MVRNRNPVEFEQWGSSCPVFFVVLLEPADRPNFQNDPLIGYFDGTIHSVESAVAEVDLCRRLVDALASLRGCVGRKLPAEIVGVDHLWILGDRLFAAPGGGRSQSSNGAAILAGRITTLIHQHLPPHTTFFVV